MLEVDIMEGSRLRSELSTLGTHFMEGSAASGELSTLKANIVDGSCLRSEPSMLRGKITDGSGIPSRKFCTWKQQPAGKRAHSGARRSPAGL